jgi:pyridoxine 5-phosphate synthase
MLDGAAKVKTDRIEFYTGPYAHEFYTNKDFAIKDFRHAGIYASELGLGINAGHDLNLDNLKFFKENIPDLLEVSIGHALVRDCLYFGLQNVIPMYKRLL